MRLIIWMIPIALIASCCSSSPSKHHVIDELGINENRNLWATICWDAIDTGGTYIEANHELIASLPKPGKQIVALYALDGMIDEEGKPALLKALGGYTSIEAMQRQLLDGTGLYLPKVSDYEYANVRQTDAGIFIETPWGTDRFIIDNSMRVQYIPQPLPQIPYNYMELIYKYPQYDHEWEYTYTIYLDGKPIPNYWNCTFIDKDNVESVTVYDRKRALYIERRDKHPELFCLSQVNLDKLNLKVKSVNEIDVIRIGTRKGTYHDYDKKMLVEQNAIRSIVGGKYKGEKGDTLKFLRITIKE